MSEHESWHRQPGETAKAFHAFVLYRDMLPKERSLEKVREKLGKSAGYQRWIETWSSRFSWVSRATAHDDHLADVKSEAHKQAVIDMADRQAREARLAQSKGVERYALLSPADMSPELALRSIIDGAKLERTVMGEPTEILSGGQFIINIQVATPKAKELTEKIMEGERT